MMPGRILKDLCYKQHLGVRPVIRSAGEELLSYAVEPFCSALVESGQPAELLPEVDAACFSRLKFFPLAFERSRGSVKEALQLDRNRACPSQQPLLFPIQWGAWIIDQQDNVSIRVFGQCCRHERLPNRLRFFPVRRNENQ